MSFALRKESKRCDVIENNKQMGGVMQPKENDFPTSCFLLFLFIADFHD